MQFEMCNVTQLVMVNPWLSIPAADYESHMFSPDVIQAQLIAELLAEAVRGAAGRACAFFLCFVVWT